MIGRPPALASVKGLQRTFDGPGDSYEVRDDWPMAPSTWLARRYHGLRVIGGDTDLDRNGRS